MQALMYHKYTMHFTRSIHETSIAGEKMRACMYHKYTIYITRSICAHFTSKVEMFQSVVVAVIIDYAEFNVESGLVHT